LKEYFIPFVEKYFDLLVYKPVQVSIAKKTEFNSTFAFSDFYVAGGLGFALDVFCVTALSFLASQSLMVLNC